MKFLFWVIIIASGCFNAMAQVRDAPVRVEIEARAEVFDLLPFGDQGVLVFYETINQADPSKKLWFFVFYNTWLEPLWSREIPIVTGATYQAGKVIHNEGYLTFLKSQKSRADDTNFQLLRINPKSTEAFIYSFNIPDRSELVTFQVIDKFFGAAFIYPRDQSLVIIRDLSSGNENTFRYSENPTFARDLMVDSETSQFWVVLDIYLSRKQSTTFVQTFTSDGILVQNIPVSTSDNTIRILDSRVFLSTDQQTFYLIGTYNHLNGKATKTDNRSGTEPSEGFFITQFVNGQQTFFRNYRIAEFENFPRILNNQQLATVSSTVKRQTRKGREISVEFNLYLHPPLVMSNEIILAADAYFPVYRQISSMSYDLYGRPIPYYYTIFDGYRYYNAFVAGFGKQGELLWTNGMKIWDLRSTNLQRQTYLYADNDQMLIFYNQGGKIISKAFINSDDIGSTENLQISPMNPGDLPIDHSNGAIVHWYQNYFLAYGYQIIQNPSAGGNRKKVFYVNKLALD